MHGLVDRGGEGLQVAGPADQQRDLERFERADEGQQQDREDARKREPQRHAKEGLPQARARHGGRLFERGIHGAQRRQHQQEDDRRPQDRLEQNHAAEREQLDRDAGQAEQRPQPLVDHALVGPEQKNPADALDDHRRGERQIGGDHHELAEIGVGARHQPGRAHPDAEWRGRSCRPHRGARPATAASRSDRSPRRSDRGRARARRRSRPSRSCSMRNRSGGHTIRAVSRIMSQSEAPPETARAAARPKRDATGAGASIREVEMVDVTLLPCESMIGERSARLNTAREHTSVVPAKVANARPRRAGATAEPGPTTPQMIEDGAEYGSLPSQGRHRGKAFNHGILSMCAHPLALFVANKRRTNFNFTNQTNAPDCRPGSSCAAVSSGA